MDQSCDVWLLTELSDFFTLKDYNLHRTAGLMAPRRRWAAVASRNCLNPLPDPHPASAMAKVGTLMFCSSILPWRTCGSRAPWVGSSHGDKTEACVNKLLEAFPLPNLVWGGDWNNSLSGQNLSGSIGGLAYINRAVERLRLQVPTKALPHHLEGLRSIDHLALADRIPLSAMGRVEASVGGTRLSDHDLYWIEIP